jgi:hypothetical protein
MPPRRKDAGRRSARMYPAMIRMTPAGVAPSPSRLATLMPARPSEQGYTALAAHNSPAWRPRHGARRTTRNFAPCAPAARGRFAGT